MEDYHSITVTERLLVSEDFSHKKEELQKHKDALSKNDEAFFSLVNKIIVGEDQKGEIVEAMKEETKLFTEQNNNLLDQVEQEINKAVNQLDNQIDAMKSQLLTITYENTPSA